MSATANIKGKGFIQNQRLYDASCEAVEDINVSNGLNQNRPFSQFQTQPELDQFTGLAWFCGR